MPSWALHSVHWLHSFASFIACFTNPSGNHFILKCVSNLFSKTMCKQQSTYIDAHTYALHTARLVCMTNKNWRPPFYLLFFLSFVVAPFGSTISWTFHSSFALHEWRSIWFVRCARRIEQKGKKKRRFWFCMESAAVLLCWMDAIILSTILYAYTRLVHVFCIQTTKGKPHWLGIVEWIVCTHLYIATFLYNFVKKTNPKQLPLSVIIGHRTNKGLTSLTSNVRYIHVRSLCANRLLVMHLG